MAPNSFVEDISNAERQIYYRQVIVFVPSFAAIIAIGVLISLFFTKSSNFEDYFHTSSISHEEFQPVLEKGNGTNNNTNHYSHYTYSTNTTTTNLNSKNEQLQHSGNKVN